MLPIDVAEREERREQGANEIEIGKQREGEDDEPKQIIQQSR
jgi:hypothetical protein